MEEALQACMLADRPAIEALLRKLKAAPPAAQPPLKARLQDSIDSSAACFAHRREAAPTPTFAVELPIVQEKARIAEAIRQHQTVIVCGETGSGKSTQLPKICLELGRGVAGLIGHTQPRRIAARSVGARIADELGSSIGDAVGYKVRFSDQVGARAYIKLMTDGILLAEMRTDTWLRQYDTLIIDEAHERSLNIDFLLGCLKRMLPRRPELRLIIASATIEPQRFAEYFSGAPIVEVSGRNYPVEVRYRPPAPAKETQNDADANAMREAVDELLRIGPGDVLVFLPGEREIRENAELLRKHRPDIEILPLYARLSPAEQDRVFKSQRGRRVVLATNVAETSLTVPGIHYVIDSGLARISRYSARRKVQRLVTESVSQASARQRLGRCGRIADGVCIRLYAQEDLEARPAFTDPEVKRTSLASVILQMAHLDLGAAESFPFLDPPDSRLINDGYNLLEMLGAINARRELTKTGKQLARLPVDPRLARVIVAARQERCLDEALIITSLLASQDPRLRPADNPQAADEKHLQFLDPRSDFLALVKLWRFMHVEPTSTSRLRKRCEQNSIFYVRLREWQDLHRQLGSATESVAPRAQDGKAVSPSIAPAPAHEPDYAAIHKALLAEFVDQIGYRDEKNSFLGARNLRFAIFPGSGLHKKPPMMPDLCVYYQQIGTCESLRTDLIEAAFDRAYVDRKPLPREAAAFEAGMQSGRGTLVEVADALVAQVKVILELHHRLRRQLKSGRFSAWPAAVEDMDSQLSHLVYVGFVGQTPARWLTQLPRFLQGAQARIDKLAQAPNRDRQLQNEIEPWRQRRIATFDRPKSEWRRNTALEEYRWMIEEYRVSLFAQNLGTVMKISAKRLDAQWQQTRLATPGRRITTSA